MRTFKTDDRLSLDRRPVHTVCRCHESTFIIVLNTKSTYLVFFDFFDEKSKCYYWA